MGLLLAEDGIEEVDVVVVVVVVVVVLAGDVVAVVPVLSLPPFVVPALEFCESFFVVV